MTSTITRRHLLQWLGGVAAGVVLSPAPFALIDDLTIATQTRGRSRRRPQGPLGRRLVRCPGCPAACRLEILTVADQPYLCVPADGERGAVGCPVLPVIHQLRLHRTLTAGRLCDGGAFAGEAISAAQATSIALEWLEESAHRGPRALLDLGPASRGITPLQCLGSRIPDAGLLRARPARAPLAALARHLDLDDDHEIAVDPDRIQRIVPIDASTRHDDAVARRLGDLLDRVVRRGQIPPEFRGTVVLGGRDGVGGRPDPRVEELALRANLALGALEPGGPLVVRRRAPWRLPATDDLPQTLEDVADASLALLLVDASRAHQAVPWRRLRRKLLPGRGRMIVFTPWTTNALQHADLVLATAAPWESEEFVGGDDLHPELQLALSPSLREPERTLVDPLRLAAALGSGPPIDPVAATAEALLLDRAGRLVDDQGHARPATRLDRDSLIAGLREGGTWHGSTVAWRPEARPQTDLHETPSPSTVLSDARHRGRAIRVRLSAPTLAGAGLPLPPVLAKLSRETHLVAAEGTARAHPRTLQRLRRRDGTLVRLRTSRGEIQCRLQSDASIEADTLVLALGFDPAGFETEVRRGVDVLGHLDLDPQLDTPDQCILEEVV
jgi:hypothetical protein